jgi:hypothetical protein
MSNINKFALFETLDETELIYPEIIEKKESRKKSRKEISQKQVNEITTQIPQEILDLDEKLKNKNQITVQYTVKNNQNEIEKFERKLNVVSKHTYENLKRLILKYKTHKNDFINWDEQKNKIKLTNDIMEMCYKDPNLKCTFIYPVAIITLKNGKTITKNYVKSHSNHAFTINDIVYTYPNSI